MADRLAHLDTGTNITWMEGVDVPDTTMAATGTNKKYPPATVLSEGLRDGGGVIHLQPITDPGSPAAGDLWYGSDTGALTVESAGLPTRLGGIVWEGLSAGTQLINSTANTSLLAGITTTKGSLTFPANSLTAGKIIVPVFFGSFGWSGSATITVQLLLGSVVIGTGSATATPSVTANSWSIESTNGPGGWLVQSAGATGKIIGAGRCNLSAAAAPTLVTSGTTNGAPSQATIDTTVSNTLDFKFQWSAASASNKIQFLGGWVLVYG